MSDLLKDARRRNFTLLENEVLDNEELSMYEKMTYIMLCRFSDDKRNKSVFPSHDTLAKKIGCSRRSVLRAIEMLTEKQYISKELRQGTSSIYTILPFENTLRDALSEEGTCDSQSQPPVTHSHNPTTPPVTHSHTNNTNKQSNKTNKQDKDQNIGASSGTQRTIFNIPPREVSGDEKKKSTEKLDRIQQATSSRNWSSVITTDFVKYYIQKHNELFPVKISLPPTARKGYLVKLFKDSFIERYQIAPDQVCEKIDAFLAKYKSITSDPRYRDCFDLVSFSQSHVVDKVMQALARSERYENTELPEYNLENIPDYF